MSKFDYKEYQRVIASACADRPKKVYRRKLSDDLKIIVKVDGNQVVVYSIFKGNVCISSFDSGNISCLQRYWDRETKRMTEYYPEYLTSYEVEELKI